MEATWAYSRANIEEASAESEATERKVLNVHVLWLLRPLPGRPQRPPGGMDPFRATVPAWGRSGSGRLSLQFTAQ